MSLCDRGDRGVHSTRPVPEDGRGLDPRRGPKPEATDDTGAGVRVAGSVTLNLACVRAWFSATKITTV